MVNVLVHTLPTQLWSNKRYIFFGGALVSQIVKGASCWRNCGAVLVEVLQETLELILSTKLIYKFKFATVNIL